MNQNSSLQNLLYKNSPNRVCIISNDEVFEFQHIKNCADQLKIKSGICNSSRIVINGLSSLELIISLCAFDGFVQAMLLLPAGTSKDIATELITDFYPTHILEPGQHIVVLKHAIGNKNKDQLTSWFLTTSGTTGTPKLIEHTLKTLTMSVKGRDKKGTNFIWGLLYDPNRFAGIQVILQALISGSIIVIPSSTSFSDQINAIVKNSVNALSATPSMWRKLLMDGRINSLSLKQITLGGEITNQQILNTLKQKFKKGRIIHIYASTEAGVGFSVADGVAGFPSKWLEETNRKINLKVSKEGHLLIKPKISPSGKEIQHRTDDNGYLDTEDLVNIDGERVHFIGRESGSINVGGNKVIPEEVENIIREVDDVVDIRVYGRKNPILGQIVVAEVIAANSTNLGTLKSNIQQYARNNLATWKVPGIITFVKNIRLNKMGKISRN